jgi:hypothetical protein
MHLRNLVHLRWLMNMRRRLRRLLLELQRLRWLVNLWHRRCVLRRLRGLEGLRLVGRRLRRSIRWMMCQVVCLVVCQVVCLVMMCLVMMCLEHVVGLMGLMSLLSRVYLRDVLNVVLDMLRRCLRNMLRKMVRCRMRNMLRYLRKMLHRLWEVLRCSLRDVLQCALPRVLRCTLRNVVRGRLREMMRRWLRGCLRDMLRQTLRCFRTHCCSWSCHWNHSRCSCLRGRCARNSCSRRGHGGCRSSRCASWGSGRSCAVRDRRSQADGGTLLRALRRRCLCGRGALHADRAWSPSVHLGFRLAASAAAKSNGACVLHTAAGAPASLLRVRHTVAGLLETAVLAHIVDTDRAVVFAAATAPAGLALRRGAEVRALLVALFTHLSRAEE